MRNEFWGNRIKEQLKQDGVLIKLYERQQKVETIEKYEIGVNEIKKFIKESNDDVVADVIYKLIDELEEKKEQLENQKQDVDTFGKIFNLIKEEYSLYED